MSLMRIELTQDQQEQLDGIIAHPVSVHDPRHRADYILVPAEQYEQMLEIVEEDTEQRSLRRAGARTLAKRLGSEEA